MQHKTRHYRPLPDCATVQKSKLHGLGLFAAKTIPANYNLGISHVKDGRFADDLIRTPLGGFINYSRQPNCDFIETKEGWELRTLRQIEAGEELTGDYPDYDDAVLATYN